MGPSGQSPWFKATTTPSVTSAAAASSARRVRRPVSAHHDTVADRAEEAERDRAVATRSACAAGSATTSGWPIAHVREALLLGRCLVTPHGQPSRPAVFARGLSNGNVELMVAQPSSRAGIVFVAVGSQCRPLRARVLLGRGHRMRSRGHGGLRHRPLRDRRGRGANVALRGAARARRRDGRSRRARMPGIAIAALIAASPIAVFATTTGRRLARPEPTTKARRTASASTSVRHRAPVGSVQPTSAEHTWHRRTRRVEGRRPRGHALIDGNRRPATASRSEGRDARRSGDAVGSPQSGTAPAGSSSRSATATRRRRPVRSPDRRRQGNRRS